MATRKKESALLECLFPHTTCQQLFHLDIFYYNATLTLTTEYKTQDVVTFESSTQVTTITAKLKEEMLHQMLLQV